MDCILGLEPKTLSGQTDALPFELYAKYGDIYTYVKATYQEVLSQLLRHFRDKIQHYLNAFDISIYLRYFRDIHYCEHSLILLTAVVFVNYDYVN